MPRKLAVITGSRAEYGLLYWLLQEIQADTALELQLVVTGMHLSPEFGLTYRNIEQDGFHIAAKVEMLLSSDTPIGIAKSIGLGVLSFADALANLKPDIVVVLGDRYEIFAAVQAAMALNIPVAHLHGGETTEGAMDEAIRHSITKMSHLHFVAAEVYRQRVIQLGESPERVFNVGGVALDNLKRLNLLNREQFETALDFKLAPLNFLVTYHPVTLSQTSAKASAQALLNALDVFPQANIIFTKANADAGGRIINQLLEEYAAAQPERVYLTTSLGQLKYLSAIKLVDVVIGNSSSGLIEVPALHKPTVNIGERQQGRLKAASVIDSSEETSAIKHAINYALSAEFQIQLPNVVSLYGQAGASLKIKEVLKNYNLHDILMKKFYDLAP
ncbi:MAG: UDP-N-acetylglucosamine 2-epimerase [Thiotrichaceae bacterium]|nr:UDP-N-acetylglucosamine 2-epimerase [Thiotrichaceae bacterium]